MQLAQIVYQNNQAFLQLPEAFATGKALYIKQKPNGNLEIIQPQGDWDELFSDLHQIGEIEPLDDVVRTGAVDFHSPLDEA